MVCKIDVHNTRSIAICAQDVRRLISDLLSFEPPGMEHRMRNLPVHVRKKWDGRIRLFKVKDHSFPTGLLPLVEKLLIDEGIEYEKKDCRVSVAKVHTFEMSFPFPFRTYQGKVADIIRDECRGIYVIGTGGGKTVMMAIAAKECGVDTLIVTPDVGLREQTYQEFSSWMDESLLSRDVRSEAPIIICNIDSLINKDVKYFERFKCLLIDEFHHSAANSYLKLNQLACNAYWRYGFTGTFVRPDGQDMIMHGVLSNVLMEKSTSDLIEQGYLVPAKITVYRCQLKNFSRLNYRDAYNEAIYNDAFNDLVAEIAEREVLGEGNQTLILVRRIEHGQKILDLCPFAVFLSGPDSIEDRDDVKDLFKAGKVRCLIATSIFREGQNLPNIDTLINARLQKSEVETKQGTGRALRLAGGTHTIEESIAAGKSHAKIYDFLLVGNKHLSNHSVDRINQYKSERAFDIKVERCDKEIIATEKKVEKGLQRIKSIEGP